MRNLHELESSTLVDLLAEYTRLYTYLLRNFNPINYAEEFQACKRTLEFIIRELEQRKMLTKNNDTTILKSAI